MSQIDAPESPLPTAATVVVSLFAAAAMTFCTPAPAAELTHERCAVHASFAWALISDAVSGEQLSAWMKKNQEEMDYFIMIGDHIVESRKATGRPVSGDADDYAAWLLGECNKAVLEGTI